MHKRDKCGDERISCLEAIIDNLPFDVWYKNMEGNYLAANQSMADRVNRTKEDIIGKKDIDLFEEEQAIQFKNSDEDVLSGKHSGYFREKFSNGTYWEEYKMPVCNENGSIVGTTGVSRDLTESTKIDRVFEMNKNCFQIMFERAPLGIALFNIDTGMPVQLNDRYLEIIGRERSDAMTRRWETYSHPDELEANIQQINRQKRGEIKTFEMEKRFFRPDGSVIWVNLTTATFKPVEDMDEFYQICMLEDITKRKEAEQELQYLIHYDSLTGLINRAFFEKELGRMDCARNLPITVIMADVNGLKMTNDAYGHEVGDEMLRNFAKIFENEVRSSDLVARVGGDEFAAVLWGTSSEVAEKVVARIQATIAREEVENNIFSVSFGWATKEHESEEIEKTMVTAEYNMYGRKLEESSKMKEDILKKITRSLYRKNEREQKHCQRVSLLCAEMAQELHLGIEEANEIKIAGLLHDIGKIGIDERLLNKQEKLADKEWEEIKRHPEISYQMLRSVNELAPIAVIVLYHHERMDGKGYPRQLAGEQIPLEARIISIVDAYDAMTNHRAYRSALSEEEAVKELYRSSGTQFDPHLVDVFVNQVLPQVRGRELIN